MPEAISRFTSVLVLGLLGIMSAPRLAQPTPPDTNPGIFKVVRAVYRYDAQTTDELSFEEGDILYIIDQTSAAWWKAKCGEKTGLIQFITVEEYTEFIDYPLHDAAKRGDITFMNECIQNEVSVNSLDKTGSTPLHWAALGGHMECLDRLLAIPWCEVNVKNKLGDTALHLAARKGHADAVKRLLEKGARTDIKNNEGKLAYDLSKDAACSAAIRQAGGESD